MCARIAAINLFQVDLDKPWNYLWYCCETTPPTPFPPFERSGGQCPVMHPLSDVPAWSRGRWPIHIGIDLLFCAFHINNCPTYTVGQNDPAIRAATISRTGCTTGRLCFGRVCAEVLLCVNCMSRYEVMPTPEIEYRRSQRGHAHVPQFFAYLVILCF